MLGAQEQAAWEAAIPPDERKMADNDVFSKEGKTRAERRDDLPPDKTKEGNRDVLSVGAQAHAAEKDAVPPNKKKEGGGDVLGVGAQAHAADEAVVPPDDTKVVSSHYAHTDHRSGSDKTSPGEH